MGGWEDIPVELIIEIYKYLSRRDRMACSMVCTTWKNALDCSGLWKNMIVFLDIDLIGPSTDVMTRQYYMYLNSLELGWANPQPPARWLPQRSQDLTKRVYRYILTLFECCVQLQSIAFFEWHEAYRLKKVVYHVCRFLRNQANLLNVSFYNANLEKSDCIRLLASCMTSQKTITYLNVLYCCNSLHVPYDLSVHIVSCVQQMINLKFLKVDYCTLSRGIIDAIITSKNKNFEYLDVTVIENQFYDRLVYDQEWVKLKELCPSVKVAIHIKHVPYYYDTRIYFNACLPLSTFSLQCFRERNQSRSDFRRTLELLLKNYSNSLENITIQIRNQDEMLDDLLLKFVKYCTNLQCLEFHGVIESMELMKEICKIQTKKEGDCPRYLRLLPKTVSEKSHLIIKQLLQDYAKEIEEKNIDIKIYNNKVRNVLYVYY